MERGNHPAPAKDLTPPRLDRSALAELRRLAGGDDAALMVSFIDQYVTATPGALLALRAAAGGPDRDTLRRLAHNLTSTSAYVGAGRMRAQAHALEAAAAAEDAAALAARVAALETEFGAVREELALARREAA